MATTKSAVDDPAEIDLPNQIRPLEDRTRGRWTCGYQCESARELTREDLRRILGPDVAAMECEHVLHPNMWRPVRLAGLAWLQRIGHRSPFTWDLVPTHERCESRVIAEDLGEDPVDDPVAAQQVQPDLAAWVDAMPWPADVVVLGMGGDGHTASWFPETRQYAQATQPGRTPRWLCTDAPGLPNVPRPRATLTLGAVRDCHLLCVHTTGVARAELLARVWQGEAAPIGAIWQQPLPPGQAMPPIEVYWAP